ncbi:MAG: hypothetical protein KY476_26230, partial [Planctomycetes bacterium]|nr:hypothetical protein [Planctomycetota bacterium]
LKHDVELAVEGLPEGWTGSATTVFADEYKPPRGAFGHKTFLTITAPEDAAVGGMAEFRVVGRARSEAGEIVRTAQPLTLYLWQEPNRFRPSPVSRAVVARPQGVAVAAVREEVAGRAGQTVNLPLRIVRGPADGGGVKLSVNRAGTHFRCGFGPPVDVAMKDGELMAAFTIPASLKPGRSYDLLLADAWSSETRKGLPGPCTRPISIRVEP